MSFTNNTYLLYLSLINDILYPWVRASLRIESSTKISEKEEVFILFFEIFFTRSKAFFGGYFECTVLGIIH